MASLNIGDIAAASLWACGPPSPQRSPAADTSGGCDTGGESPAVKRKRVQLEGGLEYHGNGGFQVRWRWLCVCIGSPTPGHHCCIHSHHLRRVEFLSFQSKVMSATRGHLRRWSCGHGGAQHAALFDAVVICGIYRADGAVTGV